MKGRIHQSIVKNDFIRVDVIVEFHCIGVLLLELSLDPLGIGLKSGMTWSKLICGKHIFTLIQLDFL